MKMALCQTNGMIGDFEGNFKIIQSCILKSTKVGASLIIFPEMAISGYPPKDLLRYDEFIKLNLKTLSRIRALTKNITVVVGLVRFNDGAGKRLKNSAVVIQDQKIISFYDKQLLPTYDVFDEDRYFEPGNESCVFTHEGHRMGLTICEDAWVLPNHPYHVDPVASLMKQKPDFIINMAASPFATEKWDYKQRMFHHIALKHNVGIIYVNTVGGHDSLVFDGGSFVMNSAGKITGSAKRFDRETLIHDTDSHPKPTHIVRENKLEAILEALILGTRDYITKLKFNGAVLGISGGIDSALVAYIAREAIGKDRVLGVLMPSEFSSKASLDDGYKLCNNLGIPYREIPILKLHELYRNELKKVVRGGVTGTTDENIQARIRGNILMAISNKEGFLPLVTGNKSEMGMGYCTLYGDMSGGLAVISDVYKTIVFALCKLINQNGELIPKRILTKKPSAELRPNQYDEQTLPPYPVLDEIMERYVEHHESYVSLVKKFKNAKMVKDIFTKIHANEYKRQQAPIGLKISNTAFTVGRRMPIVHGYDRI